MKEPFYQFYIFRGEEGKLSTALREAADAIDRRIPNKTIETMGGAPVISCHAAKDESWGWVIEILTKDLLKPQTPVSEPVVTRLYP